MLHAIIGIVPSSLEVKDDIEIIYRGRTSNDDRVQRKRSLSGPNGQFYFVLFVKTYTDRTHVHIFVVELMIKKKK